MPSEPRSSSSPDRCQSPRAGRARCNMQGCATCRIRKKACPGPSHNGDCQSCLKLHVECLRRYGEPVPVEYRAQNVIDRLANWYRERGMRRGDQKLSLTEVVWERSPSGDSEGSDHSAHPAFSTPTLQPSTPWTFRPHSPTFDQRTSSTPPISNHSTPPDEPYSSEGSLHDGPSEFWDQIHAANGRGYSSGTTNPTYPSLMNASGLPRVMDERLSTTWTTTITARLGTTLSDSSAYAGFEERGFGSGDLALRNDLSGFDIDHWTPDYLLPTEPETTPDYSNGAVGTAGASAGFRGPQPRNRSSSVQGAAYSIPPPQPTMAKPSDVQASVRSRRRLTEPAIPSTRTPRQNRRPQTPRAAHGEAPHLDTIPSLSELHYPANHDQSANYWSPNVYK